MKFDIELQPELTKLTFYESGSQIPLSSLPILYHDSVDDNMFPGDMITIDFGSYIDRVTSIPLTSAQVDNSGVFFAQSDKIIITNILKYSILTNSKYPIFYKHVIKISSINNFRLETVKIYNEVGELISQDLFIVEIYDDNTINVYMNHINNEILHIEYIDSNGIHNEMLKLVPIFSDMGLYFKASSLGIFEYCSFPDEANNRFRIHTGLRGGTIYFKSDASRPYVHMPVCNMADRWHLLFRNIQYFSTDQYDTKIIYSMPEYYLQKQQDALRSSNQTFDTFNAIYKLVTDTKAKIISTGQYIQLQIPPAILRADKIDIRLFNKDTRTLSGAYTSNTSKIGSVVDSTQVLWEEIVDYNFDGIVKLKNKTDADMHTATATFYIDNIYYELRLLDLNSSMITYQDTIALYLAPTYDKEDQDQVKLFYVFIGKDDTRSNDEKFKKFGAGFISKDEYYQFITEKDCMHVALIALDPSNLYSASDILYCAEYEPKDPVISYDDINSFSVNMFKNYLINNRVQVDLSDTNVVYINNNILLDEVTADDKLKNDEYIDFVKKSVIGNAVPSTKSIIKRSIVKSTLVLSELGG